MNTWTIGKILMKLHYRKNKIFSFQLNMEISIDAYFTHKKKKSLCESQNNLCEYHDLYV